MQYRLISPHCFLAIAFDGEDDADFIAYSKLNEFRDNLRKCPKDGVTIIDVDWNHDSYLMTMGFYGTVFHDDALNVYCKRDMLEQFFDVLIQELSVDELEFVKSHL